MINVRELPVSIKQVYIGNKKMTASIFKQIDFKSAFDEDLDFLGNEIIGYFNVNNERVLLYIIDDKMYKFNLKNLNILSKINNDDFDFSNDLEYIFKWLKIDMLKTKPDSTDDEFELVQELELKGLIRLTESGRKRLSILSYKAKKHLDTILENKLYI